MDRKRVNGPEISVVPLIKGTGSASNLKGRRRAADQPDASDIRPIFLKTGLITQANGSTYIEMGNTKVVCAVYGPRQMKKTVFSRNGVLNCDFKFSTFACAKRRGHIRDPQEKEFSHILVQALAPAVRLELLPKSAIDIYISVLENDGTSSCLAAAIIASSVALADAGIEMLDQVTACSALLVNGRILMDGDESEEQQTDGSLVISYMPSLDEVTHVLLTGQSETPLVSQAVDRCIDGCSKIYSVMSSALLQSIVSE